MWADEYVGLQFRRMGRDRAGLDCWGLVRLVLDEQAGVLLPSYSEDDPDGWSIETHVVGHRKVSLADVRALDVAILYTSVRAGLAWKEAPCHIGIALDAKNILHIEEGHRSRVQAASELRIHSIVRVT